MRSRYVEVMLASVLAFFAVGCQTVRNDSNGGRVVPGNEFPLGKLAINLPSFKTLAELEEYGKPRDGTEQFHLFHKEETKVAIIVETWGSGDSWNAVLIYVFDALRSQWVARAVWNTETRGVQVAFDKQRGVIEVRSKTGVSIFTVNIAALTARRARDW
jgi:hypothetical protein